MLGEYKYQKKRKRVPHYLIVIQSFQTLGFFPIISLLTLWRFAFPEVNQKSCFLCCLLHLQRDVTVHTLSLFHSFVIWKLIHIFFLHLLIVTTFQMVDQSPSHIPTFIYSNITYFMGSIYTCTLPGHPKPNPHTRSSSRL